MAFAPHYRISFGGSLAEAFVKDEIWNCTVNGRDDSTGPAHNFTEDTYLDEIQAALATWFASSDAGHSNQATLDYVKCNLINAAGNYDSNDSHTFFYSGTAVRGGGTPAYPQIITTAISWGTSKARGPGAHGRIYPPNNTFDTANTLEMSVNSQTGLVRAGKALLTVLTNAGNENNLMPVVASNVDASLTDITSVRVGSVKDVQRRRKDALVETYVKDLWVSTI